ncbi:MAG: arabinan endo-1,5-alpha-L-arabinosidase [Armatimonadetes bacterium Cent15-Ar3]|nr:MAG: arabinan endo-1,5-alpha-L-arabinosidase [Armatimonadetes bacterium Cent15-Ar3]
MHNSRVPNPCFPGWYADPELHYFAGRYTIYPTFSAAYEEQTFFECFSSSDLVTWTNEGRILDFANVPWSTQRAAWAPSCCERNGKYYFYFSAGDGAGIGVAVSDSPTGPFVDALGAPLIKEYHHGAQPIDAHVFVDDDGQAYLYYGGWKHAVVVRLGEDMVSTIGEFVEITPENYVEGPFMLKKDGKYYFMWSEGGWGDSSYAVAYGVSDHPLGPFERRAKILESDYSVGKGAGHHSVLQLPGTQEYVICYHRRPLEEEHHNHRVTCIDRMEFDEEGNILPVKLTFEGVPAYRAESPKA